MRQFEDAPELADDTFLLATRVLSYSPKLLLADVRLVEALLDSAMAGILVQHRCARFALTYRHWLYCRLSQQGPSLPSRARCMGNQIPFVQRIADEWVGLQKT